jgi:HSP20 family protein
MMNEIRRRMDRLLDEYGQDQDAVADGTEGGWPRTTVTDEGQALGLRAWVPGLTDKDLTLTLNQDVLTLAGERRTDVPAGATAIRRERPSLKFSRSFALPVKVDAEKVTAVVKQGILSVTLPKIPESQPRQIAVRAI